MEFYFSHLGNKRKELDYIFKFVDISKYSIIVEPFGGTCVFSRKYYEMTKKNNKKVKFIINDNDKDLSFFCNNFYKNDDKIINDALEEIKKINNDKNKYLEFIKNKPLLNDDKFLKWYLIYRTYYTLRHGMFPNERKPPKYINLKKNKKEINEFFKNTFYNNDDFKKHLEKYKNNEKALIFLDPPYIESCNDLYKNPTIDWEYLYNFFNSCKCRFIMVVNYNFFMRLAFKDYYKEIYGKKYEMSKRNDTHAIYSNIN